MPSSECQQCGGVLRRSRRDFLERFLYAEIYRCEGCRARTKTSIFNFRYARYVKCPRCHSVDLTILKRRDGIDKMQTGMVNFAHKMVGGRLYHCWFCRLQFYDVRKRFNSSRKAGEDAVASPESKIEIAS